MGLHESELARQAPKRASALRLRAQTSAAVSTEKRLNAEAAGARQRERKVEGLLSSGRKAAEPELSTALVEARALAVRLYEEASLTRGVAVGNSSHAIGLRVRSHLRSAERHDKAAHRHEDAHERWSARGNDARADFERRGAAIERDSAKLQRERATYEEGLAEVSGAPSTG
jgi:hypothetical protein